MMAPADRRCGEHLVSDHLLPGVLFLPISQLGKLRQHQVSNPRSLAWRLTSRLCGSVRGISDEGLRGERACLPALGLPLRVGTERPSQVPRPRQAPCPLGALHVGVPKLTSSHLLLPRELN